MKYLGAYMLASLGGKGEPSAQDVLKILEAGGLDCDMENANAVVNALKGKQVGDLVSQGKEKLVSFAGAGPAAGGAAPAAAAAAPAAAAPKAEAKKKEEVKEESDDDMGFGLFD